MTTVLSSQTTAIETADCDCGLWACEICGEKEYHAELPPIDVFWSQEKKETVKVPDPETTEDHEWTAVPAKKKKNGKKVDIELTCRTCGDHFLFTVEKQFEYRERGWNAPGLCHLCMRDRYLQRNKEFFV